MRLREFFFKDDKDSEGCGYEPDKFQLPNKSIFTPNVGRDKNLDMYIELVKNDIITNLKKHQDMNVTLEENEAFHELLHNNDIVIRPADKGSGVVVLNKEDYMSSLEKEMDNSKSYTSSDKDLTKQSTMAVKKLVNKMYQAGKISDNLRKYMTPTSAQPGKLKGNPKVHKTDTPLRTIVSCVNTATERIAEVAEHELNEYVESSPSYIQDTTDFINKLKEVPHPLPKGSVLFCFDVRKLYPSIPKEEGLVACEEALKNRTNPLIPTREVIEMIRVVLENNNFTLGSKQYLQTDGVAIGSKLGKNFACAYMRQWDEKLMLSPATPLFYKRFIDDGFGIWTGTEQELVEFGEFANTIHENIKIDLRCSKIKIDFLDTTVYIKNGRLCTDLYQKQTDKHLYLNSKSCHPPSTKKSLAYGLGIRLKRICESEADYLKHRAELKVQLRHRGYSGNFIERQLRKVDVLDRSELLKYKGKRPKHNDRVPLVLTYSKLLPDIHQIAHKYMPVLYRSDRMKTVFPQPPLIAYRRDKNLCDTLVHCKTNKLLRVDSPMCQDGCKICSTILHGEIKDTTNAHSFQVVDNVTCRERNIVYGIFCDHCNVMVYVGETEREARLRFKEHESDIRLAREKPITIHFDSTHTSSMAKFVVLERCYNMQRTERQIRESVWIERLKTLKPDGCNVKNMTLPITGLIHL